MGGTQSLSRVCGGPSLPPAKISAAPTGEKAPTFQALTPEGNDEFMNVPSSTVQSNTDLADISSIARNGGTPLIDDSSVARTAFDSPVPTENDGRNSNNNNNNSNAGIVEPESSSMQSTENTTDTMNGHGPMNTNSEPNAVFSGPQFGVPIEQCHLTLLEAYDHGIPTVLVKMYDAFRRADGLSTPAVFKLAPKKAETIEVAQYDFEHKGACTIEDPHAIAQLMKRWFMELPVHILASVEPSDILVACDHEGATGGVADGLPEPQKSVFLWLLDCLLDVASCADVNKMTMGNLAIVWAPNLVAPKLPKGLSAPDDPTVGVLYGKKCARFILTAIQWRGGAELIAKLSTTKTKPKVERRKSFKKKKSKKGKRKKKQQDDDEEQIGEGEYVADDDSD